jgi:DNA-binding transcriptional ArsR family regulator
VGWRFLRALMHPVRIQILRALRDGPQTARQLAERLELDMRVANYHYEVLLATGGVEIATDGGEGSLELASQAVPTRSLEPGVSRPRRSAATASALRGLVGREVAGIRVEPPSGEPTTDHLACASVEVDERGCREISVAVDNLMDRIAAAVERSEAAEERFQVTVAVASFESLRAQRSPRG